MVFGIQHLFVLSCVSVTAVMAQAVPPPGSLAIMAPVSPTPLPTSDGHHHKPPHHAHHHHVPKDMDSMAMNPRDTDHGGQEPPLQLVCPSAGFFCESTLIDYTRSHSRLYPMMSPKPPMDSFARAALVGVFGGIGGGQDGGSPEANGYFVCPTDHRQDPVLIAKCPQMGCQKDYCVGGGPATVPEKLESGDGLYCGKTIRRALRVGQDSNSYDSEDGDASEYLGNNLYYFLGSQGVNLGPCPGRCVNAGAGVPDYCEA